MFPDLSRFARRFCTTVLLAAAPSVHAACIFDGVQTFTCSGNITGTVVIGAATDDIFLFLDGTTGTGVVILSGGATTRDRVDFSGFTTPVSIDMSNQATPQTVAAGLSILFQGFGATEVRGGSAGATLTGTAGDDILVGGLGNDIFVGGPGADTLTGGAGNDTRADTLMGDCAADILSSIEVDACAAVVPAAGAAASVPISHPAVLLLAVMMIALAWRRGDPR